SVVDVVGILAQDSALHVAGVILRLVQWLQRQPLPCRRLVGRSPQHPQNRLFEPLQRATNTGLIDAVAEHLTEFREKFLGRAMQYIPVRRTGRIEVRQPVQTDQTANAMSEWSQ